MVNFNLNLITLLSLMRQDSTYCSCGYDERLYKSLNQSIYQSDSNYQRTTKLCCTNYTRRDRGKGPPLILISDWLINLKRNVLNRFLILCIIFTR